ncbi:hypothetical protein [Mucilaginibacter rubeus]
MLQWNNHQSTTISSYNSGTPSRHGPVNPNKQKTDSQKGYKHHNDIAL